jgi:hypothetical protein
VQISHLNLRHCLVLKDRFMLVFRDRLESSMARKAAPDKARGRL